MKALKKSITVTLLSAVAAIGTLVAETGDGGNQTSDVASETIMQKAMSEFKAWRQKNSERGTTTSSGGIDWSGYTSDSGWSTGLNRDSGSHRMISGLSSGSILSSQSIVKHSSSSSSGTGNKGLDRPSPASSIISEFSQIGRGGTSASTSAGSQQQSAFSPRNSGSSSAGSVTSTSRAATSKAATTKAATTAPDQFTPSQPLRSRTQSTRPSYLGY